MMLMAGGSCLSFHLPIRGFACCPTATAVMSIETATDSATAGACGFFIKSSKVETLSRYRPEEQFRAVLRSNGPIRRPLANAELARDDARAGPKPPESRLEPGIHARRENQRHDRGVTQIGCEKIA